MTVPEHSDLRIIHIIPTLGGGGAERFVVDLANEQAESEEVYLCTLYDLNDGNNFFLKELSGKVRRLSLAKKLGLDTKIYNRIRKMLKALRPDVVNTHLNSVNYVFPFSLLFPKVRFYHTIHSDAQFEIKHPLEFQTRRFFYRNKWIQPITISRQSQLSFRKYYGIDFDRLIFNGRKAPSTESDDRVMQEILKLRRSESTRILLHVGRFAPVKRQLLLAQVADELIRDGHHISLVFIGDSNSAEGEEIRAAILQLNNPTIHLLDTRENIAEYFRYVDAMCISSENEGLPISFIEALSVGCIPISTPVGGLVDFIRPDNGFLAQDLSAAGFKAAVLDFLKAENLNEMSASNKKLYETWFNIQSTAKAYLTLYESKK